MKYFLPQFCSDFRVNRYSKGGFMSEHTDNIHHSHKQRYGFPHGSILHPSRKANILLAKLLALRKIFLIESNPPTNQFNPLMIVPSKPSKTLNIFEGFISFSALTRSKHDETNG